MPTTTLDPFLYGLIHDEGNYPLLRMDSDLSWEVYLPAKPFDGTDLVNVTITPDGIYVEKTVGDWDIIPFSELSQLLEGAGCRNLDERIDLVDPRLSLIARLCEGTVVKQPGQPGYIVTGQQRIFTLLNTEDRSL